MKRIILFLIASAFFVNSITADVIIVPRPVCSAFESEEVMIFGRDVSTDTNKATFWNGNFLADGGQFFAAEYSARLTSGKIRLGETSTKDIKLLVYDARGKKVAESGVVDGIVDGWNNVTFSGDNQIQLGAGLFYRVVLNSPNSIAVYYDTGNSFRSNANNGGTWGSEGDYYYDYGGQAGGGIPMVLYGDTIAEYIDASYYGPVKGTSGAAWGNVHKTSWRVYTAANSGTCSRLGFWAKKDKTSVDFGSNAIYMAIYAVDESNIPTTRLAVTNAIQTTVNGEINWHNLTSSVSITEGTKYAVAMGMTGSVEYGLFGSFGQSTYGYPTEYDNVEYDDNSVACPDASLSIDVTRSGGGVYIVMEVLQ